MHRGSTTKSAPSPREMSRANYAIYGIDALILVGFVVLHGFVFACTHWDNNRSLLGVESRYFGRYYSAKTIHAYEVGIWTRVGPRQGAKGRR